MKHLRIERKPTYLLYLIGGVLLIAAFFCGILFGGTSISVRELWLALIGHGEGTTSAILWHLRMPRVLSSLVTGAALAVSGAVIQGALANRLASPSIIGVNAGAGLAVTVAAACGILGGWRLALFAFLGAFLTVLTVALAAKKWGASRGTVILAGVAINSLLGALSDTVFTFHNETALLGADFRVGDFSSSSYVKLLPAAALIALSLIILFSLSNELDVLTLGDEYAHGLGLNAAASRTVFLLLAAALAGAAVSLAGQLSFIGLLVPHAVRRFSGNRASRLLPLCALFGAGFVSLADTVSRTLFAPYELPVGIFTAFLGAPFFLFLLIKKKGDHAYD